MLSHKLIVYGLSRSSSRQKHGLIAHSLPLKTFQALFAIDGLSSGTLSDD